MLYYCLDLPQISWFIEGNVVLQHVESDYSTLLCHKAYSNIIIIYKHSYKPFMDRNKVLKTR